jgi:hypothetical protein
MNLKDTVKKWLGNEVNPPKKVVLKNLNQILQLLEDDAPYIATQRIKFLISDIEKGRLIKLKQRR